jgi:alkanesulfonate monooxygenase SsuD/methylene tetrahydromethanopterin reductase-like flavin-dependent oxidoreductase (luciferase family)
MSNARMKLALLLPNQGVVFGAATVRDLIAMAELADASEVFDAAFVGDNLLAKPRLESITTLSALAVRTRRLRLGVACLASLPLRNAIVLAAQWGALDNLAEGRTILIACMGGGGPGGKSATSGLFNSEYAAFGIKTAERAARMEEGIEVLRVLWTQDPASFHGRFYDFEGIAVRPPPVHKPCPPIWIASNPQVFGARPEVVRRSMERVGRLADGWMTFKPSPQSFRESWAAIGAAARAHGRDPSAMESAVYFNVHVGDDVEAAYAETKRFLDHYYGQNHDRKGIDLWSAYGPPEVCAARLREFADAGVNLCNLRLTAFDQMTQTRRVIEQVAPLLN